MKRSHAFAAIGVLSLFLVPAISVFAADIDSGLRVTDSTGIVHVAGSATLTDSKLHLKTATAVESILLVTPTDPLASKAKIDTSSGIMALKKYVGAPTTPTGLATTSVTCGGNVGLSWTASANAKYYTIYRGGVFLATTTALTFADSGLTVSTSYAYTVSASNDAGESAVAILIAMSSASCTPSVPVITVTTDATCGGRIAISWSAVPSATSYKIYRNGILATTTASITYTDTGLTVSTNYTYTVAASNIAGDSATSTTKSATSSVACAPTIPAGLGAIAESACGSKMIDLSWIPSNNTTSYTIYRYGANTAGSVTLSTTTSTVPGTYVGSTVVNTVANDGTLYTYTVVATDGLGRYATSSLASAISANTCTPTSAPTSFSATKGACSSNSINFTWTAVTTAAGYRLFTDYGTGIYTQIATTSGLSYTFTAASPYMAYSYKVLAYNGGGDSTMYATVSSAGPAICLAAVPVLNFWGLYPSSTGIGLRWTSTGAVSCTGNGNGFNLFGTWGTGGQGDPSYATGGVKDSTTLTPTGIYGSVFTGPTMFSMSCMNSNGTWGDNISMGVAPLLNGTPVGILTFIPTRDTNNNPIVNYTTGKVEGWIYYACDENNAYNSFKTSIDGGSSWTPVGANGIAIVAYSTWGVLSNKYSTGGPGLSLGWLGGRQYKLECHKSGSDGLSGAADRGYFDMFIAPRADTASDLFQSLAWFPWIGTSVSANAITLYYTSGVLPYNASQASNRTVHYQCPAGSTGTVVETYTNGSIMTQTFTMPVAPAAVASYGPWNFSSPHTYKGSCTDSTTGYTTWSTITVPQS